MSQRLVLSKKASKGAITYVHFDLGKRVRRLQRAASGNELSGTCRDEREIITVNAFRSDIDTGTVAATIMLDGILSLYCVSVS